MDQTQPTTFQSLGDTLGLPSMAGGLYWLAKRAPGLAKQFAGSAVRSLAGGPATAALTAAQVMEPVPANQGEMPIYVRAHDGKLILNQNNPVVQARANGPQMASASPMMPAMGGASPMPSPMGASPMSAQPNAAGLPDYIKQAFMQQPQQGGFPGATQPGVPMPQARPQMPMPMAGPAGAPQMPQGPQPPYGFTSSPAYMGEGSNTVSPFAGMFAGPQAKQPISPNNLLADNPQQNGIAAMIMQHLFGG